MWLLVGLLCGSGLASGPEVIAERERLRQEMTLLAQRNAWGGIERKFQKLEALGGTPKLDDYMLGARAALTVGDVLTAIDRLERGIDGLGTHEGRQQATELLAELHRRYGYVNILVFRSSAPPLERPDMPFASEEKVAIDFARKRLRRDRRYLGMLPIGTYVLEDTRFTIKGDAPMLDVQIGMPAASGRVIY
ncbi:MAG TPA: hypothetical protein ENK18_04900 [Deltaproteobacteria bacterium]|nr:hypothetical protein [Deltaproteobacteria bacterium]